MRDELLRLAELLERDGDEHGVAHDLRALAQIQGGVPDGWVMVPREPTVEMLHAGSIAAESLGSPLTRTGKAYAAIWRAAPPPPAAQPIAHGDSEREDADEAFEAIKHALEQWPESEPAILFLMGAVGPLGVITGGDIKWALSELDATDRAKAEQEGSDA